MPAAAPSETDCAGYIRTCSTGRSAQGRSSVERGRNDDGCAVHRPRPLLPSTQEPGNGRLLGRAEDGSPGTDAGKDAAVLAIRSAVSLTCSRQGFPVTRLARCPPAAGGSEPGSTDPVLSGVVMWRWVGYRRCGGPRGREKTLGTVDGDVSSVEHRVGLSIVSGRGCAR